MSSVYDSEGAVVDTLPHMCYTLSISVAQLLWALCVDARRALRI